MFVELLLQLFVHLSLVHAAQFSSLRTKIFVADDENLLCARNTYKRFLSLTTKTCCVRETHIKDFCR